MTGSLISVSLATLELVAAGSGTQLRYTEQGAYVDGNPEAPTQRKGGVSLAPQSLHAARAATLVQAGASAAARVSRPLPTEEARRCGQRESVAEVLRERVRVASRVIGGRLVRDRGAEPRARLRTATARRRTTRRRSGRGSGRTAANSAPTDSPYVM